MTGAARGDVCSSVSADVRLEVGDLLRGDGRPSGRQYVHVVRCRCGATGPRVHIAFECRLGDCARDVASVCRCVPISGNHQGGDVDIGRVEVPPPERVPSLGVRRTDWQYVVETAVPQERRIKFTDGIGGAGYQSAWAIAESDQRLHQLVDHRGGSKLARLAVGGDLLDFVDKSATTLSSSLSYLNASLIPAAKPPSPPAS